MASGNGQSYGWFGFNCVLLFSFVGTGELEEGERGIKTNFDGGFVWKVGYLVAVFLASKGIVVSVDPSVNQGNGWEREESSSR